MNNGHYTCLNIKENKVLDDETIIKTDCNNLFKNNNNIYMLFYRLIFLSNSLIASIINPIIYYIRYLTYYYYQY